MIPGTVWYSMLQRMLQSLSPFVPRDQALAARRRLLLQTVFTIFTAHANEKHFHNRVVAQ